MIYIIYLCLFFINVLTKKNISKEDAEFLMNGFYICVLILPIWYGIRECVRELSKINKKLEEVAKDDTCN